MYKIYINRTPLFLGNSNKMPFDLPNTGETLVARYLGKSKMMLNYIDMLEKSDKFEAIVLHYPDYERLVADFHGLFKIIEAAGGMVSNTQDEILMIYRRGSWDLPKGKIDPGETIKAAAIREVQEETGIQAIELGDKIGETFHTYKTKKGKRILKKTYWYLMDTTDLKLIPQTEEDIEEAIWIGLDDFLAKKQVVYGNILDVLHKGQILLNKKS